MVQSAVMHFDAILYILHVVFKSTLSSQLGRDAVVFVWTINHPRRTKATGRRDLQSCLVQIIDAHVGRGSTTTRFGNVQSMEKF